MSGQTFTSELSRVLQRPDIDDVRQILDAYRDRDVHSDDWSPAFDIVLDSPDKDPELALAFCVLAGESSDDEAFLALVAAGLMEDLLQDPSNGMAERMAAEARKFARFKWMLSGVWLHAIHPQVVETIQAATSGASLDNDPLPPRPAI